MGKTSDITRHVYSTLAVIGLLAALYQVNQLSAPQEVVRDFTPEPATFTPQAPKKEIPEPAPKSDPKPDVPSVSIQELEQTIIALQLENESMEQQLGDVFNWILVNFQGRYPLKEDALSHLKLPSLDDEFGIHPELVEFLNVSIDEQFLLEDAFQFTRGTLRSLQDQNLSITSPTPAQVMMTFSEFAEEGQALREDLYAALEASLGSERLERLLTVSEETLDNAFDHFGQASRTLMFEIILDESDNQLKLVINDGWFNEQNPDELVYSESEKVLPSLPSKYMDYQMYLPEAFSAFTQVQ